MLHFIRQQRRLSISSYFGRHWQIQNLRRAGLSTFCSWMENGSESEYLGNCEKDFGLSVLLCRTMRCASKAALQLRVIMQKQECDNFGSTKKKVINLLRMISLRLFFFRQIGHLIQCAHCFKVLWLFMGLFSCFETIRTSVWGRECD